MHVDRVYMWMGRKGEALTLAKSFIDKGGRTSWIDSYTIDAYYEKDRDLTFSREHVFALDIAELFESVKHYIDPNANKPNRNAICYIIRASGLISYSRLLMV